MSLRDGVYPSLPVMECLGWKQIKLRQHVNIWKAYQLVADMLCKFLLAIQAVIFVIENMKEDGKGTPPPHNTLLIKSKFKALLRDHLLSKNKSRK